MTDYALMRGFSSVSRDSGINHSIGLAVDVELYRDLNGQDSDAITINPTTHVLTSDTLHSQMSDVFDMIITEANNNGYTVTTSRILAPLYQKGNSILTALIGL